MPALPKRRDAVDDIVQVDRDLRAYWTRGERVFKKGLRGYDLPSGNQPMQGTWKGTLKNAVAADVVVLRGEVYSSATQSSGSVIALIDEDLRPASPVTDGLYFDVSVEGAVTLKLSSVAASSGATTFPIYATWNFVGSP